ncbi:MAG: hypothetical protein AAF587_23785 [Bacteroidota bacterium]
MKRKLSVLFIFCCCWWTACEQPNEIPITSSGLKVYQPQVFAYRGDQTVDLNWGWYTWGEDEAERADPESFKILLSENGGQDWLEVEQLSGNINQYQLSGLVNGRSYLLMLKAEAAGSVSSYSNRILFVPEEEGAFKDLFDGIPGSRHWGSYGLKGTYISYSRIVENQSYIYRYALNQGAIFRIAEGEDSDWSPIGDQIAFLTSIKSIEGDEPETNSILLHSENGPRILFGENSHQREVSWSHDGNSLVMLSNLDQEDGSGYGIWTIETVEGATPRLVLPRMELPILLTDPLVSSPRRPIWGPDSESIIYSRFVQKDSFLIQDILSVPVEGGEESIVISSQWNDFAPALSPDGNQLAFVSDRSGVDAIWIRDLETNRMRQLTGSSKIVLAAEGQKLDWHPDGKALLFTAWRDNDSQTIMRITVDN